MLRMALWRRTISLSVGGPTIGAYLSQAVLNREMISEEVDMTAAEICREGSSFLDN